MATNILTIKEAVKTLCIKANTLISHDAYNAFFEMYKKETNKNAKTALYQILENIKLASTVSRPLCQDTGVVILFVEIGQKAQVTGGNFEKEINDAVKECYVDNYFRKSIVDDPVFERKNTQNNIPCIIHTKIIDGDEIKISAAIKGAGSENMSSLKMLKPSDGKQGIVDFVVETVKNAGGNPCPPIRMGIGIGGDFEKSAVLAKKALFEKVKTITELENLTDDYSKLELEILNKINDLNIGVMGLGGKNTCYSVNILHSACHMASMPVAVNINCHSSRHACCSIKGNEIYYETKPFEYEFEEIQKPEFEIKEINLNETEKIRELKEEETVYLTGTIYTARDKAHQKLANLIETNQPLPFDLKNNVIFYAGPCPNKPDEEIGPLGPTTSCRMDKFTPLLYQNSLLATIGKGERSKEVIKAIKENHGVYFTITGGVATLLAKCVNSAEVIAFEELGSEAVFKLEVKNLPVVVSVV